MNETKSARRYARAIIETATNTQAVRDELMAVASTLESNPALRTALTNPGVPTANKKAIFAGVFSGLTAPLPRLFDMLIDGARMESLQEIVSRYRDEWNSRNNVHAAKVVSAVPLDDEASQSIRKAIETAVAGSVEMEVSVDPALVGGLKVEVDGYMFDGTVKARLKALRQHLL
ncbi:MAG: ATP synthase F1 subunit delta [Vicinamibacteria bacterium]